VYELKSVLILPLADSNEFNIALALDVNVLILPEVDSSEFNLPLALEVKLFKLAVVDSITTNLLLVLEVNVFKLPVVDSIVFNLLVALDVNVFKEDVEASKTSNLLFCKLFVELFDDVYVLKSPLIEPDSVSNESIIVPNDSPFNKIDPVIVNAPVISVFVLTLKPLSLEIDAVALPSAIRVKLSPVTPLAGILYKPLPSPINEPVKEPVVYEPVKFSKLEVSRYSAACDADMALDDVPEIVALMVP
jgi:hypothetical protein